MKLIEADKVEQAIKDYWKAQVDRLPRPKSIEEHDAYVNRLDACLEHNSELLKEIEALPSVQPERKTGHWIYGEDDGQDGWYCSECNGFVPWDYEYYGLENIDFIDDFKVCPFCEADMISRTGADMRGEQNG